MRHDAKLIALGSKLFPFEYRFRQGLAEYYINSEDDRLAIPALYEAQKSDPNSPTLAGALFLHLLHNNDGIRAMQEFAWLYRLAPSSDLVKEIMKRKMREP